MDLRAQPRSLIYGWGKSVRSVYGALKLGLRLNSCTGHVWTVHRPVHEFRRRPSFRAPYTDLIYGWGKSVRSVYGALKLGLCLNSCTGRCTVQTRQVVPAAEQKKLDLFFLQNFEIVNLVSAHLASAVPSAKKLQGACEHQRRQGNVDGSSQGSRTNIEDIEEGGRLPACDR